MCHPAWGPAHAPAPYPRELVRVRRFRDLIDRDGARRVQAAHHGAPPLPPDVAAALPGSGIVSAQLRREFTRAYGVSPEEYASAGARGAGRPSERPRGSAEKTPCASVIAPAFSAGR